MYNMRISQMKNWAKHAVGNNVEKKEFYTLLVKYLQKAL